jgi:hypothetical protein
VADFGPEIPIFSTVGQSIPQMTSRINLEKSLKADLSVELAQARYAHPRYETPTDALPNRARVFRR